MKSPQSNGGVADPPASSTCVVISEGAAARCRSLLRSLSNQPGEFVVAQCPDSIPEVFSCAQRLAPCLLVVDHGFLSRVESREFGTLVETGSGVKLILLTGNGRRQTDEELLLLGCRGILDPSAPVATLRRAVRAVAAGEIWAPRLAVSKVVQSLLFADRQRLTSRESQILKLIAQGHSNREIAEQLFISRETVRWHMRSLYAKIGAHDRFSAVNYARDLERRTATA